MAAADEVLVHPGAVEVGAPDRPVDEVGPVDVRRVDRNAAGGAAAADEALVHPGAVEVGPPDRPAVDVGPVDVRRVDRYPARAVRAGDEALIHARAVEVGAPDRPAADIVGPVDVRCVDRQSRKGYWRRSTKLWFAPVPSRLARPIVVPPLLAQ